MTASIRRAVAAATLAGAAVLASAGTGHAVSVSWSAWDQGTTIQLTGPETTSAVRDGVYVTSGFCATAINLAVAGGIAFPDPARANCAAAVVDCARVARNKGNALSAARLMADGSYKCLDV